MPSPEATFDTLFVVSRLQKNLQGVTAGEVQLFDYLARLLALFRGNPSADWGFLFVRTRHGVPFCPEISEALEELQLAGLLEQSPDEGATVYRATDDGTNVLTALSEQETLNWRSAFLEAACSSSLMLPIAKIREALRAEPTIKSAINHVGAQELLAGPPLELLYEQFEALRTVLGDNASDLLVPSSVWLAYLLEQSARSPQTPEDLDDQMHNDTEPP